MVAPSPPEKTSFAVTRSDFLRYAGAAGDYHPLHTSDAFARSAGMPSLFAHGMYSAGLLSTAVNRWVGVGNLLRFRVRFVGKTWPDDTLTTSIEVTGSRTVEGEQLVDFTCALSSSNGDLKVTGSGTARLPGSASQTGSST